MTNFCPKCGTQQAPTNLLCFKCGALLPTSRPQQPHSPPQAGLNPYIVPPPDQLTPGYPPPFPQTVNKSRAMTSMIFGLLSVPLLVLWGLGVPFAIIAVILGRMELNAIRRGELPQETKSIAMVGFVSGLVTLILLGIIILLVMTCFGLLIFSY
ncbi:MAG: hypothetical protein HY774_21150 [Acidobacteria bacterium]|nr:hypothetical protein [Acidobacteriota bacterium]